MYFAQLIVRMGIASMVDAKQAEAAEALLRYLASPEIVPVLRLSGLEP